MDPRDSSKVVEHLASIKRSLVDTNKASERTAHALERLVIMQQHPSNGSVLSKTPIFKEVVPVQIDWENPYAVGLAQAYKHSDGKTTIEITIDSHDTERIDEFLRDGFVEILSLSVVEK